MMSEKAVEKLLVNLFKMPVRIVKGSGQPEIRCWRGRWVVTVERDYLVKAGWLSEEGSGQK